jgi:serine protease DegQ
MKPGDVVIRIGGKAVRNTSQLMNSVAALKPQSEALFGVQRGAQVLDLKVVVAQRPAKAGPQQRPAD